MRSVVIQQEHSARHLTLFDELLRVAEPTKQDVQRFTVAMPHGSPALRYFFDNLASPGWLKPLVKKGYFATAPGPVSVGNGYRLPSWPQTGYLQRVAHAEPDAVGGLLASVEHNGNWLVVHDLIDVVDDPFDHNWCLVVPCLFEQLCQRRLA